MYVELHALLWILSACSFIYVHIALEIMWSHWWSFDRWTNSLSSTRGQQLCHQKWAKLISSSYLLLSHAVTFVYTLITIALYTYDIHTWFACTINGYYYFCNKQPCVFMIVFVVVLEKCSKQLQLYTSINQLLLWNSYCVSKTGDGKNIW